MITAEMPKKAELIASDQMAANVSLVVVNLATHSSLPHKFGRHVTSAISLPMINLTWLSWDNCNPHVEMIGLH